MPKNVDIPFSFAVERADPAHCPPSVPSRLFVLAGGTANLRAQALEQAAQALETAGQEVTRICTAANHPRLCGVEAPGLDAAAWDWTQPAARAPVCPGVGRRVLSLDSCLEMASLAPGRERLLLFYARAAAAQERARRYLDAAGNLLGDTFRLALECADLSRLDGYAARFARRLFFQTQRPGHLTLRRLTAVTADGVQSFVEPAAARCAQVFVLQDDCGLGRVLLSRLRDAALRAGQDVVACPCGLFGGERPEHLLLPGLSLGLFTSSRLAPIARYRRIHLRRFLDADAYAASRARVTFNRRAAREMLRQAALLYADARRAREAVRADYDAATDWDALAVLARRLSGGMSAR